MNKSQVRETLYRALEPLLPGWKLVKKQGGFVRKIAAGNQKLLIPLIDYNPEFRFSLVFLTRLDVVEEISNRFSGALGSSDTATSIVQLSYFLPDEGVTKEFAVRTEEEIRATVFRLAEPLDKQILPFLD